MPENVSWQALGKDLTAQSNYQRTVLTSGRLLTGSQRIVIAPANQVTLVNKKYPGTKSKSIEHYRDNLKPTTVTVTENSRLVIPKIKSSALQFGDNKEPVRIVLPPQKSKGQFRTKMSDSESPGQSNSHLFKSAVAVSTDLQQSKQHIKTSQDKTHNKTVVENEKLPSNSKVNLSKPEKLQTSKSSQKYLDYLEEMELRIRYMKNDIEFKQNQMQFRKTDKTLQEKKPKHSEFHVKEQKQILKTDHDAPVAVSSFKLSRFRESDIITSRFSTVTGTKNLQSTKWTKPTSDNLKTQVISQQFATVPLPGNSMSASGVTSHHSSLSSYKVSHVNTIQSSNTQAGSSAASQLPKPMYLSPNKRSAIFIHNPVSGLSVSSHDSVRQALFSSLSQDDKNQLISYDSAAHTSGVLLSQSQELSTHQATSLDNKFKLVYTQPSKGPDQLSTPLKISAPNNTSTPNPSSTLVQRYHSKKTPTLNTQSAAKLVSKYKLKRLSPTSAVRLAPQLYRNATHSLRISEIVKPSSYDQHKNIHKLDRRKASEIPNTKFKDSIDVIKNKQKPPHYVKRDGAIKPYKWDQMKLEKAAQANTAVRRLSGHSKNLHKLDRRTEKLPGHVFRRRRSKHHWVSHKLASSQEESLVVEPPHLSQDYFQCSTIPGQNPKSRFKWLRPSLYQLHAQNLLRQKMKQRLKMGYGRTHKYAGFNTEKSLWQQSQALKARQYRFKGNMIHIGGVLYKSSSRKLIKARRTSTSKTELTFATSQANRRQSLKNNDWRQQKMKLILLRGAHFNIDTRRRKLSRAVLSSSTGPSASDSGLLSLKVGDEKTRIAASRAVYRSIAIATAKFKKNNTKSRTLKQHCIFFGRFGKCFRGDDCPYIHDAAKVAVCTRFLRGKCEDVNCPFSHKASVNKMPVCLFYLRGSCSRDGCPYLHVKVNPDAPVCRDFHNGFCSLGDKCKKLHSFVCPSFADTGTCSRGSDCPMLHRISRKEQTTRRQLLKQSEPVKKRRLANSQASSNTAESLLELVQPMAVAINTAPLTSQPSFISLLSTDNNPQTPAADIRSQVSSDNKELRSGEQEVSARIMPVFLTQQISKSTPHKSGLDVCEPHVTAQEKIVQSEKVTLPPDASSFDTANDEQVKTGYQPPVQSCPAPSQPGVPIKIIPSFLSQNKSIEAVLAKNVVVQSGEKNSINL